MMKIKLRLFVSVFALITACVFTIKAQIAQGGGYTLDQSVIASGGGQNAVGGSFALDGTIGQSIAGTNSTNSPFSVKGGFWTVPQPLSPTGAVVSVAGRILTPDGRGLKNARVILTDFQGATRTAVSGVFGYFRFSEVEVGQTYIFTVVSKRYQFAPQVVTVLEEIEDLNFVAQSVTAHEK